MTSKNNCYHPIAPPAPPPPRKQAVVFILDASPSMNQPYPPSTTTTSTTRLDCAKQAIQDMVCCELYNASSSSMTSAGASSAAAKQHRMAILVCHTPQTKHHLYHRNHDFKEEDHHDDDDTADGGGGDYVEKLSTKQRIPYPHLTQLGAPIGLSPIRLELLRELDQVQVTTKTLSRDDDDDGNGDSAGGGGDFMSAIFLAADALRQKTAGQKYQRRIVLLTDAGRSVVTNRHKIMHMIATLCSASCETKLQVIGLGFHCESKDYEDDNNNHHQQEQNQQREEGHDEDDDDHSKGKGGEAVLKRRAKREHRRNADDLMELDDQESGDGSIGDRSDTSETKDGDDDEEDDDDDDEVYDTQLVREALLLSLANATGGSVIAASTLKDVLEANQGQRIPKASPKQLTLHIAPSLHIPVRSLKRMDRYKLPTMKTMAVHVTTSSSSHPPYRMNTLVEGEKDDKDDELYYDPGAGGAEQERLVKNELGQELLGDITSHAQYVALDDNHPLAAVVEPEEVTTATRFGGGWDLLPMTAIDDEGVAATLVEQAAETTIVDPNPNLQILGYLRRSDIPVKYWVGPSHVLSGGDNSVRSCALLAALAQALHRLDKVAMVIYHRTKHSSNPPILGALFPFDERQQRQQEHYPFFSTSTASTSKSNQTVNDNNNNNNNKHRAAFKPIRLVFIRLPYADDVQALEMPSLQIFLDLDNNNDNSDDHDHEDNDDNHNCVDHDDHDDDDEGRHTTTTTAITKTQYQQKAQACDAFIDAMMLPDHELQCGTVPCPLARSWHQTVVRRALNHTKNTTTSMASSGGDGRFKTRFLGDDDDDDDDITDNAGVDDDDIVASRRIYGRHDPMTTPPDILQQAQPAIAAFQQAFPDISRKIVDRNKTMNGSTSWSKQQQRQQQQQDTASKRKRILYYKEYL